MGTRRDERGGAPQSRNRRSPAGGIHRGLARSRNEDRSLSAGDRRLRWRHDLPVAAEGPGCEGKHSDRAGVSARDHPRRADLRVAEPERAERELHVRRNARRVFRAAARHQWAATGPRPPRGRRINRINGSITRKIAPSRRNSTTKDTIDACCCTIPKSAA